MISIRRSRKLLNRFLIGFVALLLSSGLLARANAAAPILPEPASRAASPMIFAAPPPEGAIIVDDGSGMGAFIRNDYPPGSPYWWSISGSYSNGQMWYTWNSDTPGAPQNWGIWTTPPLPETGEYTIVAQIPPDHANTTLASYQIAYSGGTSQYAVNQSATRGQWVVLGTYAYTQGDIGSVTLDDVVPETRTTQVQIGFDAMVWLPPGVQWEGGDTSLIPYDPRWAALGLEAWLARAGDPVSTALGNFSTPHQDLYIPGRGLDVDFTRSYNSIDTREDGGFGLGWHYTYGMSAIDRGNGEIIVTFPDGRAGLYVPDGGGYTSPDGFLATLTGSGGELTLEEPDGTTYTFDSNGRLTSIADPNGNTLTFEHDEEGYTLTDTVGRSYRVVMDRDNHIREITDPIGRVLQFEYDGNKLVTFRDANGGTLEYAYNGDGLMESITDPNGNVFVTNTYDAEGRVISQQDASGSTTTFEYKEGVTIVTDNLGNQTVQEFNDKYQLVKETDALGHVTIYDRDDDNNLIYLKEPGGAETFRQYDDRGNLTEVKDALGQFATFTYNAQNDLIYHRDFDGAETHLTYDERRNLVHIQDAAGGTTQMTYDSHGQRLTLTDPNGATTQFAYNSHGNLESVVNALNQVTTYEYDGVGRTTAMTDANGNTVRFEYDPNDRITTIIDPKGQATSFDYDAVGNLTSTTDRRNWTTTYEYNANDSLIRVTDPRNNSATFTYDKMYNRISATDRRGHTTYFEYDAVYNLIRTVDAKGHPTTFTYDADRNLIELADALNQKTTFTYDALHRLVSTTNALEGVTAYTYDPVGRPLTIRDPKNGVTRYNYDALGRLLTLTDALNNETTFAYDAVGNLLELTNARGFKTLYTYDAIHQLVESRTPMGFASHFAYDGVGNTIRFTDPRGNNTLFAYDANDNLVQVTDALNGTLTYTYDAEDNQRTVTDQNGHTTSFEYDPLANLTKLTLPLGQETLYEYDPNNNLIALTNAKGNTTRFTYDEVDLLVSRTTPLGFVTQYSYDALRRMIRLTDAENNATQYGYDALDRLVEVTDALGGRTRYEYDPLGNLTAQTDANTHRTTFDVDLLGRVTGETNPIGNRWEYTYDPVGNLIRRLDANGITTNYIFDADDRLTNINYPLGTTSVVYAYDPNSNLTKMTDGTGQAAFAYDALNRLTQVSRTDGLMLGRTFNYAYDPASNRTRITYPDGKQVRYEYNANDWLVTTTDPLAGPTRYNYDPVGLPIRQQNPNRTWTDSRYDADDRLVHIYNGKPRASTNLTSSFDYTLDKVGNRIRTVERATRGQTITWDKTYTYDATYRLLSSLEVPDYNPAQVLSSTFGYDPVGNRLWTVTNIEDEPNTPPTPNFIRTDYTYNAANQMLTANDTRFGYDGNGSRTSMIGAERVISYTYDIENRLIGAETYDVQPNGNWHYDATMDYSYDGLGRRLQRGVIDNGIRKTADFFYDGLGYDLLAQFVDPGSPRTTYYYRDLTQILSRHEIQGNGKGLQYFHHYDGLGSVSAWTNQSGRETQEYTYAPYGRLIDNNGPDNSSNTTDPHNNLTFSGKPWDKETELYYFGARDYDPATGTWLQQDPYRGRLNDPVTLHRYQYVRNNPTSWVDPYGFDGIPSGQSIGSSSKATLSARKDVIAHSTSIGASAKSINGGTSEVYRLCAQLLRSTGIDCSLAMRSDLTYRQYHSLFQHPNWADHISGIFGKIDDSKTFLEFLAGLQDISKIDLRFNPWSKAMPRPWWLKGLPNPIQKDVVRIARGIMEYVPYSSKLASYGQKLSKAGLIVDVIISPFVELPASIKETEKRMPATGLSNLEIAAYSLQTSMDAVSFGVLILQPQL